MDKCLKEQIKILKKLKSSRERIDWISENSEQFRKDFHMLWKNKRTSKTLIFNIAVLLCVHAGKLTMKDIPDIDPEILLTIVALANVGLRFLTYKKISLFKEDSWINVKQEKGL